MTQTSAHTHSLETRVRCSTYGISYEPLSLGRLDDTLNLICDQFRRHEPLTRHLNVSEHEFRPYAEDLMATALLGELSWIAVDEEANKVIGARLISDCKDVIFPSKSYGPNMDLIVSLLNHLTRYDHNLTCPLEIRAMHAHIVSVHQVYTGKKVAAELFNHATFWGKSRGYSILRGEITSYYNYKILRNFKGFRCLNEVRYNLFETQGIKPFAGVSRPHETCIAYEIDLKDPTALETRVNYVPK